jgi:hypothetical protein
MSSTREEKDSSDDPGRDQTWFLINVIMHTESKKLEKVGFPHLPIWKSPTVTNICTTLGQLGHTRESAGHFQGGSVSFHSRIEVSFYADST